MDNLDGKPQLFEEDCLRQKILVQSGEDELIFLKMTDF